MGWRGRLRDLVLAGGAFAATSGCSGTPLASGKDADLGADQFVNPIGCGNANPDPCICGRPEASALSAMQCEQEIACQAQGGSWQAFSGQLDGVASSPHCALPDAAASRDGALDR